MSNIPSPERGASPQAIQQHYDVGSDFYALWLDNTLTYSCALWLDADSDGDLETAQIRKIDHHIISARARRVERVLDVGCGWGAVLRRLVSDYGVRHATGLTLSVAQAEQIAAQPD